MEDRWFSVSEVADYIGVAKTLSNTGSAERARLSIRLGDFGNSRMMTLTTGCVPAALLQARPKPARQVVPMAELNLPLARSAAGRFASLRPRPSNDQVRGGQR